MLDSSALGNHSAVVLGWLLRASLSAAGIAIIVLGIQVVFRRWLSPAWRYRLWGVVVLRLTLPTLPSSPTSIWNTSIEAHAWGIWTRMTDAGTQPSESKATTLSPTLFRPTSSSEHLTGESASPGVSVMVVKQRYGVTSLFTDVQQSSANAVPSRRRSVVAIVGIGLAWIAGVLALATRLVVSNLVLSRRLKDSHELRDENILGLLRQCCREMGVRTPPPLLETDAVVAPAAAGIWRQQIFLSPGLFESLKSEDRRAVLLHELAHIRRHDVLLNWLLAVVQIAHWFNPFIWIALARLRADREVARDAMVLGVTSGDTNGASGNYVRTLLRLTECVASAAEHGKSAASTAIVAGMVSQSRTGLLPGMLGGNRGLKRRIQMAAQFSETSRRLKWVGSIPLLVLASVLLTDARSQSVPTTKPGAMASQHVLSGAEQKQAAIPATQSEIDKKNIQRLVDASRDWMKEGQYAKALTLADEILKLDPTNDYAAGIRPLLADKVAFGSTPIYTTYVA
jgi:bla regulator protein BlaR1